jgi:hypothetical protein
MEQNSGPIRDEGPKPSASGRDLLEGIISEREFAAQLGISVRTAQRARQLRISPPYFAIGRRVFYRVAAVRDWLAARERHGEHKPRAPRSRRSNGR